MKRFLLILIIAALLPISKVALSQEDNGVNVKFSGFVKTDIFFNTRQTVDVREGHFYLYPQNEVLDENGDDINAVPNFNILNIQTRGRVNITVPDVLGAKATGFIEGAFFGSAGSNINTFRLRHAFGKLDWGSTVLLVGQYWHPMFRAECFPGVVNFNTGVPFQPFSRNPQIRLQQYFGDLQLELTAASQRDFASTGPNGTSSIYLRNAVIPDMNFGLQYQTDNFLIGALGEYKMLLPRTHFTYSDNRVPKTLETDEKVASYAAMAYTKISAGDLTIKAEGIYGQNLTNMTMLGGYYQKWHDPMVDPAVDAAPEYTPVNILSVWGEFIYGKEVQFAIFGGYTQNMGADFEYVSTPYSRGSNIENVMRISPRLIWNLDKFRFAFELDYTSAGYGNINYNDHAKVEDAEAISNIRGLVGVYVFF